MEDWIEKLNTSLSLVKWNSGLAELIKDYMNRKDFTRITVDGLLMQITKLVETSLRGAVEQVTAATVPPNTNGIGLLNYARKKGFIPEPARGSDALHSLVYWYFEKPRNTSHHAFTDFPVPTLMMFISSANLIINEIERLNRERKYYGAETEFNYDASLKALYITVADITKDNETIVPPVMEMRFADPQKSVSRYPLDYNGSSWTLKMSIAHCGSGTYSVSLAGYTKETDWFMVSGSTILVI